jgi:hypothetical protein
MARPLRNDLEARVRSLPPLRCTEAEYALVQGNAQTAGMSVSSYMRQMLLRGRVVRKGKTGASHELVMALMGVGNELQRLRGVIEAGGGVLPVEVGVCMQKLDTVLLEVL